jgi:hypothetical protein
MIVTIDVHNRLEEPFPPNPATRYSGKKDKEYFRFSKQITVR